MSLLAQDERLTRRVGAVTMILIGLATVFFVFVYDQLEWGARVRLRVYFLSTGGLQEGAAFVVAGADIGHVESIAPSPRGAPSPLDGQEGVVVTVVLDADDAARVTRGGDVFVTSRGALSSRYLELAPAPGPGPALRDGDELRGRDPPSLDRVLQRTWDNLNTAAAFAAAVRPEARALAAELDRLRATLIQIAPDVFVAADLEALLEEGRRTYAALGADPGVARMRRLAADASSTIDQARTTISKLRASADLLAVSVRAVRARLDGKGGEALARIDDAVTRVRAAIDKVDPLLAQVEAVRDRIIRGEGSLLKLARDPEFPEDAKELGKILKRQPWRILDRPPK